MVPILPFSRSLNLCRPLKQGRRARRIGLVRLDAHIDILQIPVAIYHFFHFTIFWRLTRHRSEQHKLSGAAGRDNLRPPYSMRLAVRLR